MKKIMICLVLMGLISFCSCSTSKIGRLDLETNYKIIEDIIQNPDTLIYYKMQDESNQEVGVERIRYLSEQMIGILKTEFDEDYIYVYGEVYQYKPSDLDTLTKQVIKSHSFTAQINSLKSGRNITFKFFNESDKWTLFDVDLWQIGEFPNVHRNPYYDKGEIIDLVYEDNCKLYFEDNYKQINELLQNSDSLYNLYLNVIPKKLIKSMYYKSKEEFHNLIKFYNKGYYVVFDRIGIPDSTLQAEGITVLNRITISEDNVRKGIPSITFNFMKKNGVWQFYDRKLNNYPNFP